MAKLKLRSSIFILFDSKPTHDNMMLGHCRRQFSYNTV